MGSHRVSCKHSLSLKTLDHFGQTLLLRGSRSKLTSGLPRGSELPSSGWASFNCLDILPCQGKASKSTPLYFVLDSQSSRGRYQALGPGPHLSGSPHPQIPSHPYIDENIFLLLTYFFQNNVVRVKQAFSFMFQKEKLEYKVISNLVL